VWGGALRDNETMPVIGRIDVHERERFVILQQFEARHLTSDDFTKRNYALAKPNRQSLNQR